MEMFKVLILVTIFFLPSLVNALDYSPEGEVTGMYAGNDNTIGVFHSAAIYNPAGCPSVSAYLFDDDTTKDISMMRSMVLSAYVAKLPIKIGPSRTRCFAGFPVIERVAFKSGF